MLHLATCPEFKRGFWDELLVIIKKLGLAVANEKIEMVTLGRLNNEKAIDREAATIIAIGWRCLYAEITRSRANSTQINIKRALKRAIAMTISRARAYGEK